MLIDNVRPKTLKGVKSLATQLRKEQGIKHSVALDLAAKAANCTNFRNAQRTLPGQGTSIARPYVLLTIYWHDKKQQPRTGRETLKIELSKPLLDICGKTALKKVRGFSGLRMVAADHFVCDELADSQNDARKWLCTAERSLRFMEHTGLRPCRDYRRTYPATSGKDQLPDNDHSTDWVDSATDQFVLIDEPYGDAHYEAKRAAWAERHGWRVAKTSWPGMYNPYDCDFYVATDGRSGYEFDALVAKINAMPAPLLEKDWPGESSPSWNTFLSPMAKTPQDLRRARCRGTIYPAASATTVPYSYSLGCSQRRPAGEMGYDNHIDAGRIIRAVLKSYQRLYDISGRMNSLRSTLEGWMSLEIGGEHIERHEFFDVYYRRGEEDNPYQEAAKSRAKTIAMLGALKQKLQAAYPDCAPLRKQLHRIDMSVSVIVKTNPADD